MLNAVIGVAVMFSPVAWLVTLELNDRAARRRARLPERFGGQMSSIVWYM